MILLLSKSFYMHMTSPTLQEMCKKMVSAGHTMESVTPIDLFL